MNLSYYQIKNYICCSFNIILILTLVYQKGHKIIFKNKKNIKEKINIMHNLSHLQNMG